MFQYWNILIGCDMFVHYDAYIPRAARYPSFMIALFKSAFNRILHACTQFCWYVDFVFIDNHGVGSESWLVTWFLMAWSMSLMCNDCRYIIQDILCIRCFLSVQHFYSLFVWFLDKGAGLSPLFVLGTRMIQFDTFSLDGIENATHGVCFSKMLF